MAENMFLDVGSSGVTDDHEQIAIISVADGTVKEANYNEAHSDQSFLSTARKEESIIHSTDESNSSAVESTESILLCNVCQNAIDAQGERKKKSKKAMSSQVACFTIPEEVEEEEEEEEEEDVGRNGLRNVRRRIAKDGEGSSKEAEAGDDRDEKEKELMSIAEEGKRIAKVAEEALRKLLQEKNKHK